MRENFLFLQFAREGSLRNRGQKYHFEAVGFKNAEFMHKTKQRLKKERNALFEAANFLFPSGVKTNLKTVRANLRTNYKKKKIEKAHSFMQAPDLKGFSETQY